MNKAFALSVIVTSATFGTVVPAHAALVSQLLGLDIDGTLYDVTFHTDSGDSFMALWDADNDGVFGGGSSVFSTAPLFWNDRPGAELASSAIIAALGSIDWVIDDASTFDRILVPYGATACGGAFIDLTAAVECISHIGDQNPAPGIDSSGNLSIASEDIDRSDFRYASFTVSEVPVPAAAWLFGSGLLGLIGVARKKNA